MAGVLIFAVGLRGQSSTGPDLPRPGTIVVADATGEVTMVAGEQRRRLKADERLRVGAAVTTGRKSMVTLQFSNGASVQLGPESELEIEEFGQAPVLVSPRFAEMKAEPTVSRTQLRLGRGDVNVEVKPLNVLRGSSFTVGLLAGTLRMNEGSFRAMLHMSDLGIGVFTIEVQTGSAEFEPLGGAGGFKPVPAGRKVGFAIEHDRATGAVKLGELPGAPAKKAKE